MSNITPKSYIITQSSNSITDSNAVVPNSSNQTTNVISSVGIASSTNYGNMSLIGLGIPEEKNTIDIRIQKSGTIVNESTFIWKDSSASQYWGTDDLRFIRGYRAPFSRPTNVSSGTSSSTGIQACHGATAVYADFLKKEFLYYVKHVSNRNVVHVAHRTCDGIDAGDVDESNSDFTLADITLPVQFESSTGDLAQVDVCTTINNTILMVCSADQDLQLFESTDGLTWTLVASDILKRFMSEDVDVINLTSVKIASSGSYVRVICTIKSNLTQNFIIMGSSDHGKSFKQLNVDNPISSENAKVPSYADYNYAMDICSVRDSDGSFLLVCGGQRGGSNFFQLTSNSIIVYLGVANGDFSKLDNQINYNTYLGDPNYSALAFKVPFGKLFLCKTDSDIILFDTGKAPLTYPVDRYSGFSIQQMKFSQEIRAYRLPLDGLVSSNEFNSLNGKTIADPNGQYAWLEQVDPIGTMSGFRNGCGRYWFGRGKFYFIGNCIAYFGTMVDTENGGVDTTRHQYFRAMSFSYAPVNDTFPIGYSSTAIPNYAGEHQPKGTLFQLQWKAIYGLPVGTAHGIADSPYTETITPNEGFVIMGEDRAIFYISSSTNADAFYKVEGRRSMLEDPDAKVFEGSKLIQGGCFLRAVLGNIISTNAGTTGPAFISITDIISSTRTLCSLRINEEAVFFIDSVGSTVLIDHTSLGSGTEPFRDYFWEIRFLIEANPSFNTGSSNIRFMIRRTDQNTWFSSGVVSATLTQQATNIDEATSITFGVSSMVSDASPQVTFKELDFHIGSSLGMLDKDGNVVTGDNTKLRGRSCNTLGTLTLQKNMKLAFGGGSSAEADTFTLSTQDVYSVNNTVGSGLLNWQSTSDSTDSEIIFKSNKNAFNHNGWGLFGLNCKTLKIEYSNDATFSTGVNTIVNTDLGTGVIGRVDTVYEGNETVTVTFDSLAGFQDLVGNGFASTDKNNYYARFTALSAGVTNIATDESFKVIDHFDNKLVLDGTSEVLTAAVGSTLQIYSDRITIKESSSDSTIKQYMRVTLGGDTFEGYHTLGSVVAGQAIEFEVPMDWAYTDSENANIQNNLSRSGVKWAYPEGPPTRTISGRIIGDVTQYQRSKMRTALRKSQYSAHPLVLVLEESSKQAKHPNNVVLARYVNEFAMDNAGWYYDTSTETWYSVGDVSVTFEEEV